MEWQNSLRALSAVVEMFATGQMKHPDDSHYLERLQEAETKARQAYQQKQGVGPAPAESPQKPLTPRGVPPPAVGRVPPLGKAPPLFSGEPAPPLGKAPPLFSGEPAPRLGKAPPVFTGEPAPPLGRPAAPLLPPLGNVPLDQQVKLAAWLHNITPTVDVIAQTYPSLAGQWYQLQPEVIRNPQSARSQLVDFRNAAAAATVGHALGEPVAHILISQLDHLLELLRHLLPVSS